MSLQKIGLRRKEKLSNNVLGNLKSLLASCSLSDEGIFHFTDFMIGLAKAKSSVKAYSHHASASIVDT